MMGNKAEPLISIIVPVYNTAAYLKKCVESILAQTYTNLEIILVDDGSTDMSGKICDDFKKDSRVRVIHQPNGGPSVARNAGLDVAQGEYFSFVDSDDYVELCMYEKLYDAIQNDKTKLAVCARNYVYEDGKKLRKTSTGMDMVFNYYDAMIEMNSNRIFDMGVGNKLFQRELFDGMRFPPGKLSEDYYVMFLLFERAGSVSYVDAACYNYFHRRNSLTRSVKINHDHEYAAEEQMKYLDEKHPELKILGHVAYATSALTVYDFYLKNGVQCPKQTLRHFKNVVNENREYINKAEFLSLSKRIQFSLFCLNVPLYNMVFKLYRKVKRV